MVTVLSLLRVLAFFGNWVPLSLPVNKPYNMVGVVYFLNYVTLRQTKDSFEYNVSIPKDSG